MRWPPRSPDLTPYDFFLWRFVKDTVFVPPLPADLQDLHNRITAAVALVDRDMLTRVCIASGTVTLCERPCGSTRNCTYTIKPPDDEHNNARNMYRIVILYE